MKSLTHNLCPLATILTMLLSCGCSGPRQRVVLNNTGHVLTVRQDGEEIARLRNGEQVGLDENWLIPKTTVTVTGHTPDGLYVGADSWTFLSNSPEIWQINQLRRPQESR